MFSIMVVEDDPKLNRLFCTVLSNNGFKAIPAFDGVEALHILDESYVDLIITDLLMPQIDGFSLIETLRDASHNMPVLIITSKEAFDDKEKGFSLGVDDYMVKPIDVNEMVLRVNALLRRAKIAIDRKISCGSTLLDYDALTLSFGNEEILLPQKEFQLIYKLISYPNKIFTRQKLMDEIWGYDSETDERTVDVHINRLRERLKNCADLEIVTVRGLGYKAVKRT